MTPEMLETLDRWGVRHLRAFAGLPEVSVSERLGQEGVRLQKLARGEGSRPLVPAEPPLTFEEAIELEHPVSLLEPLAFILNRMLEQLCTRLATRALATQELRLRCELEGVSGFRFPVSGEDKSGEVSGFRFPVSGEDKSGEVSGFRFPVSGEDKSEIGNQKSQITRLPDDPMTRLHERVLRLPVPMLDAKIFLKLLQLDLKSHPPPAPVMKIWLAAEPVRARAAQGGLFLPAAPEAEKLELTLARLSGVAGEGRVGAAELVDTHRPERFRMRKFGEEVSGFQFPVSGEKASTADDADERGSSQKSEISRQSPVGSRQSLVVSRTNHKSQITNHKLQMVTALRVFRPPLRASVEVNGAHPVRVSARQEDGAQMGGEVVWLAGPWRASGDWWTEHPWTRETWDIALRSNPGVAVYRVFRDGDEWFVEGTYD
jgi:hypothetical protein